MRLYRRFARSHSQWLDKSVKDTTHKEEGGYKVSRNQPTSGALPTLLASTGPTEPCQLVLDQPNLVS